MTRQKIASLLTELNGGKSRVKLPDVRELLKDLIVLDARMVFEGNKGVLQFLEDESDDLVNKLREKEDARLERLAKKAKKNEPKD